MIKFKTIMDTFLLIILSTSCFIIPLAPREYVLDLISEKYVQAPVLKKMSDIYKYKNQEMQHKLIHTGMSAECVSNGIGPEDFTVSLMPAIRTINAEKLLKEKFSEKQQKETLEMLTLCNTQEVISEEDVKELTAMSEKELTDKVFDSDIVLKDIYAPDNINCVLQHPLVQARLDRFEKHFKYKRKKAWRTKKINKYNKALHVIKQLRSEEVSRFINQIHNGDFATANKAIRELKSLFLWEGKYIYGETYPIKLLGIDLLKLVDDDFKTRGDIILNRMGQDSLNEIEQFSQLCGTLQGKNDVAALADIYYRLENKLAMNLMRNETDEICYVIVVRALQDPINITLGNIKYGSWNAASAALDKLEQQVGPIPEQRIIPDKEYLQKSLLHRFKFSRLAAAQKLYKARSDYRVPSNLENKINIQANTITETINVSETREELLDEQPQVAQKIEESKVLSIQCTHDLDALVGNCISKIHDKPQSITNDRLIDRINAINQTRNSNGQCFDYSSRVVPLNHNDSHPKEFQNTYGTELDCQLHQELCHIRNTMSNLEQTYAGNVHVETLAPIVYDYTIQAKCEQSALLAFELTDLCHTITQVLESGMHILYDATTFIGKGVWRGVNNFASIEHWKDMATGMVTGPAHLGLLFVDVMTRADELDYAMIETLTTNNSEAFLVAEEKYRTRMQNQNEVFLQTYGKIKSMPWQEVLEHGSEIGTTVILDTLALHVASGLASQAGNLVIEELSSAIESGAIFTEKYAVEVAGFGKLAIEEGAEISTTARQVIENDTALFAKNTQLASQQIKQKTSPLTAEKNVSKNVVNENKIATKSPGSSLNTGVLTSKQIALHKFEETKHLREIFDKHVAELLKNVSHERCGKILPDDANVLKRARLDALTEAFYNDIRKTTADIECISRNTNISKDIITKIKSHVFLEDHILYEGVGKFGIDEDMAAAWQRLIDNKFIKSDLILLQHEYSEALLMNGTEIAYSDAHPLVNQSYNWYKSL